MNNEKTVSKMTKAELIELVRENFSVEPDYPFENDSDTAVLRHNDCGKWFGIVMNIPKNRLGLNSTLPADILNVKCDPEVGASFVDNSVFFPAYHMNKRHWLSVLLEKAGREDIMFLLNISYDLTRPRRKK